NVHDTPIVRTWYVVGRSKTMSRAAQDFHDFVLAHGRQLLDAFFASPQSTISPGIDHSEKTSGAETHSENRSEAEELSGANSPQ
ncbi:MAG: hypothetical protein ACO3TB_04880, partial [Burkholderiaceae bacterium]